MKDGDKAFYALCASYGIEVGTGSFEDAARFFVAHDSDPEEAMRVIEASFLMLGLAQTPSVGD